MAQTMNTAPKGKKNALVVPTKKTMNFARHESSINPARLIPVLVVVVAAGALFAKFGIMDQLDKKSAAYADLAQRQEQLAVLNAGLTGYDELYNQHGRYSYSWMTEEEINTVGRMDVLKLIEDKIVPACTIENFAVNKNVLTLNIYGLTLDQASKLVNTLKSDDLVKDAMVYKATAEDGEQAEIFMSITLTKEVEEDE